MKVRLRAAIIHLGISLAVAAIAALLVLQLWYPYPYSEISGGRELFLLIVAVDVVLGPLITFCIFSPRKTWASLRRDLAVVGVLQCVALSYGLWTVFVARPVLLSFEVDRFRVVHAIEVPVEWLEQAPPELRALSMVGPRLIAVRPFVSEQERMQALTMEMSGISLSLDPHFWRSYEAARPAVVKAALPVAQLIARFPARDGDIRSTLAQAGIDLNAALYLPLAGRREFWTAFLDPISLRPVAFLPLDPF